MSKLSETLKIIREQYLAPVNLLGNLGALLEADTNTGFMLESEVIRLHSEKTGLDDANAWLQMRLHNLLVRAREEMEAVPCTK